MAQALTRQKLIDNAFRTLGLSGSASQAQIESAARRMRIWPDPKFIPPTPWDVPALGPVARTRMDLDQAISRLSEPASRLEQRLLWFLDRKPPGDSPNRAPSGGSPAERHDLALVAIHSAIIGDPDLAHLLLWREAMTRWSELASSEAFFHWLSAVESDGQFEKRADSQEIREAIADMPVSLAMTLLPKAQPALDRDDLYGCLAIAELVKGIGPADGFQPIGDLLNTIEDTLTSRVREIDKTLRDKLRTNHSNPIPFYAANRKATTEACAAYSVKVEKTLIGLRELCKDDPDRCQRVRSACAPLWALIGLGWEWSGKFDASERIYIEALELARGSSTEGSIESDLARCRSKAETKRIEKQRLNSKRLITAGIVALIAVVATVLIALTADESDRQNTANPPQHRDSAEVDVDATLRGYPVVIATRPAATQPDEKATVFDLPTTRGTEALFGETNREP